MPFDKSHWKGIHFLFTLPKILLQDRHVFENKVKQVVTCKMNAMALSDHAPVELGIDINTDVEKKGRWRMNTLLKQDENFNLLLKEDIKSFFEINAGSTDTKAIEWEASKAYIRGKIIAHSSKKKKENMKKITDLEKAIKDQEMELTKHFSDELYVTAPAVICL